MSDATTHERLAAWLDGEAALYRERAQRAEDAQDWDPAVRYAGAADALVQLRDRVLRGLAAIFGQWPGDETDEEIEAALAEMERCHCGGDAEIARLTRELEEVRSHARRVVVALRAICDEASICGPPLERRREEWEAALSEADEVLGEMEVLYGAR